MARSNAGHVGHGKNGGKDWLDVIEGSPLRPPRDTTCLFTLEQRGQSAFLQMNRIITNTYVQQIPKFQRTVIAN
jgi:hypothetical protein